MIKADEDDWSSVENAFRGEMVSVKNELAAYESLYGLVIARMQADKAQVLPFFVLCFVLTMTVCTCLCRKSAGSSER